MCAINMHCICCAKNFEIKMCINQTITMFSSEEMTSLPNDKCRIDFKNNWHTVSVLNRIRSYLIYTQNAQTATRVKGAVGLTQTKLYKHRRWLEA